MPKAKKILKWGIRFLVSFVLMGVIIYKILSHQELYTIKERILGISFIWLLGAFIVQLIGMSGTVIRWRFLLSAQKLKLPLKYLIGSFLIGRFIGSFLPSTIGLDGYRIYDIARQTGRVAASVSVIVVEKIIGFFVLSCLIILTIPWGVKFLPLKALFSIALFFSLPVTLSFLLLLKPIWIRRFIEIILPKNLRIAERIIKATEAVTTYQDHRRELIYALLSGFIVHLSTSILYYFTAHSIGVEVTLKEILFVGPLMIFATVIPISVAGIGVREAVIGGLFLRVGHSLADSALFAFIGYLVGEIISLFGGIVLVMRGVDYKVVIRGEGVGGSRGEGVDMEGRVIFQGEERKLNEEYRGEEEVFLG